MPTSLITVVFIVWIILPGTLFKRFYFQGFFAKQFGSGDFADRIITSVFWGMLIQIATFWLFYFFGFVKYEDIKSPITAIYRSFANNEIPDFNDVNFNLTLTYIIAALTLSVGSGFFAHTLIRFLKVDTKYRVFRFANQWHYYLMGDITSLKNHTTSEKKGSWISTQADIVVKESKEKPKMFSGHISDYFISGKGDIESIILRNAKRWCDKQECFKPVPGDALMVPYLNVMDMNLTYVTKTADPQKITRRKEVLVKAISILGAMCSIIFPLFTQVSFVRKFGGIMMLLMALIIFVGSMELFLGVRKFESKKSDVVINENEVAETEAAPSEEKVSASSFLFALALIVLFTLMASFILNVDWLWAWVTELIRPL